VKLFFAIEPDDPCRSELLRLQAALRGATRGEAAEPPPGITWSPREQLHVTVQYLGSVADPAPVVAAARAAFAGHAPFELAVGPLGSFGDSAPRVVWAGLAGDGLPRLHALAAALARELAPLGLVPDQDEYRPHFTLARVRGESGSSKGRSKKKPPAPTSVRKEGARALAAAIRSAATPATASFRVAEVVLFESREGQGGPVYFPLERLPLS